LPSAIERFILVGRNTFLNRPGQPESGMFKGGLAMKSLTCAAVLGLAVFSNYAFAQAPMGHGSANMSDDDLIKAGDIRGARGGHKGRDCRHGWQ
jgi:hypothetical protein